MNSNRQFLVWPDLATYHGEAFVSGRHSHFFSQISFADSGFVELRGRSSTWHKYKVALVPSGVSHEMQRARHKLTLIYLDPLTIGFELFEKEKLQEGQAAVEIGHYFGEAVRNEISKILMQPGAQIRKQIIAMLARGTIKADQSIADIRVAKAVKAMKDRMGDISLQELARSVDLSTSRFRHLFGQVIGIPFSAYRLWLKTHHAVSYFADRPDLANVAYNSGFADQAHFSRIFRRSFGMNPSSFTRGENKFSALFFPE